MFNFFLALGVSFLVTGFVYADNPSVTPASASSIPLAPQLSDQEIDELLIKGEAELRKIKVTHVRQERKAHVKSTEEAYQEAVSLYHQQRPQKARVVFAHVQDSMVDYKSTESFLRVIDNRNVLKAKESMRQLSALQEGTLVIGLAQRASKLYQQAADLGDDEESLLLRKKLSQINELMQNLKEEKEKELPAIKAQVAAQQQLAQLTDRADLMDQEVSKLIKAGNYAEAKKRYEAFESSMENELKEIRASVAAKVGIAQTPGPALKEKGYKQQEEAVYRLGIDLYNKKEYGEARVIFNALAKHGDNRAQPYLKKINRILRD